MLDITQNKWKVVNEDESETYTKYKFNEDGTYILNGNTLTLNYADGLSEFWEYNGDYFLLKQDGYDNEMTEVIDVYKLINFIPDTFTFYIDYCNGNNVEETVGYTAENDMTWEDWVNSEYNIVGVQIFEVMQYLYINDMDHQILVGEDEFSRTDVKAGEAIDSIHYYCPNIN